MKIDRMSLPSLDTKCLIASYNFWSSLTGIPSVCLCASANVNPEQLLHSVNTLHEEQVCVWSQELEGSSPSPEHEEWNWTISEIQLNLCWTTALSHFSEVVCFCELQKSCTTHLDADGLHKVTAKARTYRSDEDPWRDQAGQMVTTDWYTHGQQMMNVPVSPDYPWKLVIAWDMFVLPHFTVFCCHSFCGSP